MKSRRIILTVAMGLVALLLAAPALEQLDKPIPVVATGEHNRGEPVKITTLVGPNCDTHVYQPTPADARAVS